MGKTQYSIMEVCVILVDIDSEIYKLYVTIFFKVCRLNKHSADYSTLSVTVSHTKLRDRLCSWKKSTCSCFVIIFPLQVCAASLTQANPG